VNGNSSYTSVYLPKNLKQKLVEAAQTAGFQVGRGRQSRLAKFIEAILHEHMLLPENEHVIPSLYSLAPELRSSITRLSKEGTIRQKRAGAMLELLLADWQEEQPPGK